MSDLEVIGSVGSPLLELFAEDSGPIDSRVMLETLDAAGVEWHVSESGDLFIKAWQLALPDFATNDELAGLNSSRDSDPQTLALDWVSEHLPTLQERYAGRWIAVSQEEVVADAANLPDLLGSIAESHCDNPLITQIPATAATWKTVYAR